MRVPQIVLIYFFYGLAFFTMGVVILQELEHSNDKRLRNALRFLAAFGLLHGANEWLEMFQDLGAYPTASSTPIEWQILRMGILAFSFVLLGTFGIMLMGGNDRYRRLYLLVPLVLSGIWGFGLLALKGIYPPASMWDVIDAWTRYVLAIPGSLLACAGLINQQREFRRAGMAQFGRDTLWAAVAFAWYGLVGQLFVHPSALPPSDTINATLFYNVFGFPIQWLRAAAAVVAAVFVVRFLRSFQVETQRRIEALQAERLEEAHHREALRGELLHRVVVAQESERQRIARELHDDTGQALTAIGLGLRGVATTLRSDPEKAISNLRQLERMVGNSMDGLQRTIGDLRPSHLDDLGLAAALRWYANELQTRTSLNINVEIMGEPRPISTEVKTAVFRIAQEALTNVVRHAKAKDVKICLNVQKEEVILLMEDNGSGFDMARLNDPERPAWGVLGMQERASLLGGKMNLFSEPGKGTRVEAIIPCCDNRIEEKSNDHTPLAGG